MRRSTEDVEVVELMDRVLTAALREVRAARARRPIPGEVQESVNAGVRRKSNTRTCIDILTTCGRPLHVGALLGALEAHGIHTSRESLVSAITKKLTPRGPFVRTAPNTFGLADRDSKEL